MKKPCRNSLPKTASVALLALTTLGGCALSGNVESPARSLSGQCEYLSRPVALPDPRNGKDLGVIAAENRTAAVEANKRLAAATICSVEERQAYKNAK